MADVRAELEAMIRKEFEPAWARLRMDDSLSDEEWWDRIMSAQEGRPESRQIMLRNKEEMIRTRPRFSPEIQEMALQRRVREVLPYLEAVREEGGASGEVTTEEYLEARGRSSRSCISAMMGKMADHLQTRPEDGKSWIIRRLLDNAQGDAKLMDEMLANPSDETCKAFSDQVCKGMEDLAAEIRKRRGAGGHPFVRPGE